MFVPTSQHVVADRYELIEEIGRGSMGVIWRARQTNLGIECAIKFIHAGQAHDPELRRRFVREARAAASLKSAHSVHILDVDEWQGCLFIAMELLIGETLEARLERVGRLSPELTLEIVDQVARGLNKAHAARLVHRDLKPDNIFLVDDEPLLVKILDFGIAKRLDAIAGTQTASGALLGTPGYMSPEQAVGAKNIDYRSDLWSLAVVVFRCLTGVEPFNGDGIGQILVEIVKGPLRKPSSINPHLPASLDEWWLRATEREPSARHESATALVNDLRQALDAELHWPPSALEPTVSGGDFLDRAPATLEPMLAAQRLSNPAAMRYSVAMVPALIVCGWFIGRAMWPATLEAWSTEPRPAAAVSFAVAPVTAAAPATEIEPLPPLPPASAAPVEAAAPVATPPAQVEPEHAAPTDVPLVPAAPVAPAAPAAFHEPQLLEERTPAPAATPAPAGATQPNVSPGIPGDIPDVRLPTAGRRDPRRAPGAARTPGAPPPGKRSRSRSAAEDRAAHEPPPDASTGVDDGLRTRRDDDASLEH